MSNADVPMTPTGIPSVDALMADVGGMVAPEEEPVGGMFVGPTGPIDEMTGEFVGPYSQESDSLGAAYTARDVQDIWTSLPLEYRVRLQDTMVAVGLTNRVMPGEFDDGTLAGLERLLSLSNRSGTNWRATLGRLEDMKDRGLLDPTGAQEQVYDPQPYLAPDYATMAQQVKGVFRAELGRDPDQGEMAELVAELQGWDRQAYEVEEGLRRSSFDAATTPGTQAAASAGGVDPLARFRERFESLYSEELDFVEDKASAQRQQKSVRSAVDLISQASRSSF